jgi:[acyl-carrier-protein] S-malonyltransferase/trans-AT polyketide synthase/acyltransferase/oxidoreductase domain-containing protein
MNATNAGISTAFVFPGQGSQHPGMARDFYDAFAVARSTFEEASDVLRYDVAALCFNDGDDRLDQTAFTQPALLTSEIAMTRALSAEFGIEAGYYGGHSLGEYTALTAAGTIPLATAVRIVQERGALMQRAVPAGQGAMIAVVSKGVGNSDRGRWALLSPIAMANHNSPDQVVLSGPTASVEAGMARIEALLEGREHRIIRLNVSAPFHCPLMKAIHQDFRAVLETAAPRFDASRAGVVTSNFTGAFHTPDATRLVDALVLQTSSTVEWTANMARLCAVAPRIYEVGPDRTLGAFFRSIGKSVVSITSLRAARKELA